MICKMAPADIMLKYGYAACVLLHDIGGPPRSSLHLRIISRPQALTGAPKSTTTMCQIENGCSERVLAGMPAASLRVRRSQSGR
jgi:hypothetical protein